jgi:hypothetical protein
VSGEHSVVLDGLADDIRRRVAAERIERELLPPLARHVRWEDLAESEREAWRQLARAAAAALGAEVTA